ncbi:discoidin domain-containing protein [Arthrobacter sp. B2a2-09]|uniref:discoidin domain-containing protein n=1 Tax=Arthrobacter sp. B2a2-09 TaxID=2952822 RepID=UPI0022CD39A1|nr:discoidin domain-containing protein [Arthrobacter sp. B2a2-09]MCZ9880956.1 right-handed parallel beta-helix repeat-containing protein [Arthrobacter sp. B2a2-09]
MIRTPLSRSATRRSVPAAAILAAFLATLGAGLAAPTPAHAAIQTQLYVSPTGTGTCVQSSPCSVDQAQAAVRALARPWTGDVVVNLAGGTYTRTTPLTFGPADSGQDGFKVRWQQADAGAPPVFSGAQTVTGWTPVGTTGIYKAPVPTGITDTRQIYVNGQRATRARSAFNPAGFTLTSTGYTTTPAASLAAYKNPGSIEFVYNVAWTNSRCSVGSVSGNTVTMANPCWFHTHDNGFLQNNTISYVENAYELLTDPGQWYLDKTGNVAGDSTPALYYKPKVGETLTGAGAAVVTVPGVQKLLSVAGTGTAARVHDLQFVGITFADATWLQPNSDTSTSPSTSIGFAETQANFISVDATIPLKATLGDKFARTPGAVDIAYANDVLFQGNTLARLGGAGLDVEKSSYNITVLGNSISDVSGSGVQIGDITPQDQRPANTADRMHDITVQDNYIHDVAVEFQGGVGLFAGFVDTLKVLHNEIANVPYSGMSIGWGWGWADQGGTGDGGTPGDPGTPGGETKGSTTYTTPTIAANNQIDGNYVHHFMAAGSDGGAVYMQGSQPNSTEKNNYYANSPDGGSARGIYLDNGTQHYTVSSNVVDRVNSWLLVNEGPPSAKNNSISGNWSNTTSRSCCSSINTYGTNTDTVVGQAWPAGALAVINAAGLETNAADSFGTVHNWAGSLHPTTSTTNLASGATATGSSEYSSAYSAANAIDGSTLSRWAAASGATNATLILAFPSATDVNRVVWQEGKVWGSRIHNYTIDYWDGAAWQTATTGAYPGVSQVDTFASVNTTKLRLNITSGAGTFMVSEFEAYHDSTGAANPWTTGGGTAADGPAAVASKAAGTSDAFFRDQSGALEQTTWNGSSWSASTNLGGPTGGTFTGVPAVASSGAGLLDVFVRGTDNKLYHRAYSGGAWETGWDNLGGTLTDSPAAASKAAGTVDVFVNDSTGIEQTTWNGTTASAFTNLGSSFTGAPAVTSWGSGRLDLFIRSTSNQLLHKYYSGGAWGISWEDLGGNLSDSPAATSKASGTLDVFIRDTNGALEQLSWTGTAWSSYTTLGAPAGSTFTGAPAAVSSASGALDVFVRGTDKNLYRRSYANSTWGTTWAISAAWSSFLADAPAVASKAAGTSDAFFRDQSGALEQTTWNGSSWSASTNLGGPTGGTFTGVPAVASSGAGLLDVFVRGTDNKLYHRAYSGGAWETGWDNLGGTLTDSPAAASKAAGTVDVFVNDSTGIEQTTWNGTTASAFTNLGSSFTGAPAVTSWGSGRLDLFIRSTSNQLLHKYYSGGAWGISWEDLGGNLSDSPAATSKASGTLDVFIRDTNGALEQLSWTGTAWSSYTTLAAPPAGTTFTGAPAAVAATSSTVNVLVRGTDNRLWFATTGS